jgi:hypothetical protein
VKLDLCVKAETYASIRFAETYASIHSLRVLDLLMKAFWAYMIGKWFFNWTGMTETLNEIFTSQQATNSS